jgi:O-antigen/teichoic acid export membrane protein
MSKIKQNIAANFIGNFWTTVMGLVFLPIYIKFVGIEAYGLVGFLVTLQAVFSLLDMGLSTTLNRELARLSVYKSNARKMRDMVRSLEIFYWIIACLIGVSIAFMSPIIAQNWLNAIELKADTVQQAIMVMGWAIALQFSTNLYAGGLLGLQRQVLYNCIISCIATLRGVGAVFVLWRISPTVQAFFVWQIAVNGLQLILTAGFLWHSLPKTGSKARVNLGSIREIWRFAVGVGGTAALALILTHLDKIILSRLLTLEFFGYYTLAGTVAMGLYRISGPIFLALYPRFTQLATAGDAKALVTLYHIGCQLMTVLILPVTLTIAFFSREILFIWTQNSVIVEHTSLILSLLTVGISLNGLMHLPYALQLAYGWTKLAFYTNLIATTILGPLIYVMATQYGSVGAATVWIFLNGGYILFSLQIMHRRLLPTEKWRWYLEDSGKPFLAAFATIGLGKWLIGTSSSPWLMVTGIIGIYITSVIVSACAAPQINIWIKSRVAETFFVTEETKGSPNL